MKRRGAGFGTVAALWLVAWAVYAAYFQGQWAFGERPIYHITGDEPHYLVVATSLVRDGDLDVLNNYRDKDYTPFYPYHLGDARDPEDMHAIYGHGGRLYSKHSLGLSLLLAPALRLGGQGAALPLMMALTAALAVQIYLLALDAVGSAALALATWLALAFSAPLLLYAGLFYPEVAGGLLTAVGLRAVLRTLANRPHGADVLDGLAVGLAAGLLPWFHLRYLPLAVVMVAAAVFATWPPRAPRWRPGGAVGGVNAPGAPPAAPERAQAQAPFTQSDAVLQRRGWRRWAPLGGVLATVTAAGFALLAYYWRLFGGVPAVGEYGALTLANVLVAVPGLLLDQQYGLLMYAPVFGVALLGLPLVRGALPGAGGLTVWALLAGYFGFIASFSIWYGAFSPPARMLVPVVPVLAVPFALALHRWRGAYFRLGTAALLLAGWSIAHLLMDVPRLRYNLPTGESELLRYLSHAWQVDLVPLLPSFVVPSPRSYAWALIAVAVLGAAWQALVHNGSRPRAARRNRRVPASDALPAQHGPASGA